MRQIKLSATSIATFKACPTRYRLRYVEGLKLDRDTDAQRVGTNWHSLHEVYRKAYRDHAESMRVLRKHEKDDTPGTIPELSHETAFAETIDHLNNTYAAVPDWADPKDWALERQILATCFAAYLWYYAEADAGVETLATEFEFDMALVNPLVRLPMPTTEVTRVGKIDRIRRWGNRVGVQEYKSTSKSIDDGSDYWDKLRLDDQVSMYDLAFHTIRREELEQWGVKPDDVLGVTLYDVWHKPTISPKTLTQGDTATFIESRTYYADDFVVEVTTEADPEYPYPKPIKVVIDGEEAEFTLGKKGWALTETVTMFGSRLMADIAERPEFYFRRREVVRTAAERERFQRSVFNVYQAQRLFEKIGCWYQNPQQCKAPMRCDFYDVCHGPTQPEDICDGKTTPAGFRRSVVNLTIGGQELD